MGTAAWMRRIGPAVALAVVLGVAAVGAVHGRRAPSQRLGIDRHTPATQHHAVVAIPAGPTDGKNPAGHPVSVDPSEGLHDRGVVTVRGSEFPPATQLGVVMCRDEARHGGGADYCDLGAVGYVTSDGQGAFETTYHVNRLISTPKGVVDCGERPQRCAVAVGAISDYDQSGSALVSFDATEPLARPTLAVTPATGLRDGDRVTVRGSGFPPGSTIGVDQCADPPPTTPQHTSGPACGAPFGEQEVVTVDAGGRFTAPVAVHRQLWTPAGVIDCADAAARCRLVSQAGRLPAESPVLGFDGTEEVAAPTVSASPTTGLRDGDQVTVHGRHLPASMHVDILECAGGCRPLTLGSSLVPEGGRVDVTVNVSRRAPATAGFQSLDCAEAGSRCVLRVAVNGTPVGEIPLSFDPSVPRPPGPALGVDPDTGLADGARVALHLRRFPADAHIDVLACVAGASLDPSRCQMDQLTRAQADGEGALDAALAVRRYLTVNGGPVDCASSPGACVLIAVDDADFTTNAAHPLTFSTQ